MKFTILINQKQLIDMGLQSAIKAGHIAIMEVVSQLFSQAKSSKLIHEGVTYVWASPALISSELPFFDISSSRVRHMVTDLVSIGFLERHPNNQNMGKAFVTFGPRYEEYTSAAWLNTDNPLSKNGQPPCPKTDTYNTTNEKTIKEDIESAMKFQDWVIKKMHYVKIHPPTVLKIQPMFLKLLRAGYSREEIRAAVEFGTTDVFWRKQFLSPLKLDTNDKQGVKIIDVFLANYRLQNIPAPQQKAASSIDHLQVFE